MKIQYEYIFSPSDINGFNGSSGSSFLKLDANIFMFH